MKHWKKTTWWKKFKSKYLNESITNITDFRFAQKKTTTSGTLWKGVDDYVNIIYTFGSLDSNGYGISFDYQHHFNPPQSSIIDKIEPIIDKSKEEFECNIINCKE